jgi:hypothetical protein
MGEDREPRAKSRKRLLGQLDQMVKAGRVTETEAARLRAARNAGDFDETVREIRVRHAGAHLAEAIESGEMIQAEADAHLAGLRNGEHPRSLRARLRALRPRAG